MHKLLKLWAALLPFLAALGACSGAGAVHHATPSAHLAFVMDTSASVETPDDSRFGQAELRRIGAAVDAMKLGDRITVYEAGAKSAERAAAHPAIITGYKLQLARARTKVLQQVREIADSYRQTGGDGATNLLFTLENLHADCASGRSKIVLISDGVEDSDAYSASAALNADKSVDLPAPQQSGYLTGCSVEFLGFGVSKDASGSAQVLPDRQLRALRQGWVNYLKAAGVASDAMSFASIL